MKKVFFYLSKHLDNLQSYTIHTKQDNNFVCQCCVELLSMDVKTTRVEPVIRSALLNVAGIEVGAYPSQVPSQMCKLK